MNRFSPWDPRIQRNGRTKKTGEALTLFWTGSGVEFTVKGTELALVFTAGHDLYEQWIRVELDGATMIRMPLERGETRVYRGNYSDFAKKKAAIRIEELRAYEKQQREIRRQEEIIERFRRYNTEDYHIKAQSREKLLSHVVRIEKPADESDAMRLRLTPAVTSGNDVLSIRGLSKGFGEKTLFTGADIELKRGEKLAVIGDNGTGKTTLLKILTGDLPGDSGEIVYGTNVYIGYYDQEHGVLDPEKTIFQEISDAYPDMTNTEIRNMLAAFLFTGDDVYKLIGDLSGGEKGRVSLAKLMLSDANLLILDEPTNHLDMTSKEILENALNAYEGTVLFVSHDRYFIRSVATRILELYDRHFLNYIGGYDYYLEKRDLFRENVPGKSEVASCETSDSLCDWKRQKEEQAKKRKYEKTVRKLEEEIDSLEEEIAGIDRELSLPENASKASTLTRLTEDRAQLSALIDEKIDEWAAFSE